MTVSRIEKTFRCRRDGRAVARIIVREDGRRQLVIPGGRDGHTTSLRRDLDEARAGWESDWALINRHAGPDFYADTLARLQDPDTTSSESVHDLPSELDVLAHSLGKPPFAWTAPCPRCHVPTRLTVHIDDNNRCDVLASEV